MQMKAHGEFPDVLYRSFDSLEYARQFVSGFIRFGAVRVYRKIEDKDRRDETEGIGKFQYNGKQGEVEFTSNEVYILCCYKDIRSALISEHGKFIVEISNPLYLAEELTKSLRALRSKHFGGIEGVMVDYTKGDPVTEKPSSYQISRLTYTQKPQRFSHENEFRYIFIRKEYAGNFLFLQTKNGIGGFVIHDFTKPLKEIL
jgi:hypothetical protein